MIHVGYIMSTLEDVQYIGFFNINSGFYELAPTHESHDIPPMCSRYSPDVLNTHYTGW